MDSQSIASIINLEQTLTNDKFKPVFNKITARLEQLYRHTLRFKAGYLNSHDWRPMERNKPADLLCNTALQRRESIQVSVLDDAEIENIDKFS